jgi:cytochrome c-type biogenesis protein CcmE
VSRAKSPVRLALALSIAALLAVFLLYTSIAGGGTPSLRPSQLLADNHDGKRVTLSGKVIGAPRGDAQEGGLHFRLRDVKGTAAVPVVYRGSVPDMFRTGRDISVDGRLQNGTFVGVKNTLVTKCPSKYSPKKS